MNTFIAGLIIFFGIHLFSTFRSRAAGKDLRTKLGYGPFMGIVSLISGIGLGLIIWGYVQMRPSDVLYLPPEWGRHASMGFMILAMIVLVSAYMPNGYIKEVARHPMLMAVMLWGAGHLLANGELNSVLLFGSFLVYALIDRVAVAVRGDGGGPKAKGFVGDILSVAIGVSAYAAVAFWLHPILFGVPVIT